MTSSPSPWSRAWSWLLADQKSVALPLLRIFVCGVIAVRNDGFTMASAAHKIPSALFHVPTLDALGLPFPPSSSTAIAMAWSLKICAALAALGVLTRASLLASFALLLYAGAVGSGFGFFNHTPALAAQLMLALAILPGSTGLSVYRVVVARVRRAPVAWLPPAPRFGEVIALLAIGSIYAAAGVAKLRFGGAAWLSGETLRAYLAGVDVNYWHARLGGGGDVVVHGYAYRSGDWASFLARIPGVPLFLTWFATLFELGAPVLLLAGARARAIFVGAALLFHFGILVTLGPGFDVWIAACLAVFPWVEAYHWGRPRFSRWRRRRRGEAGA